MAERAIEELGGIRSLTITPPKPEPWMPVGAGAPAGAPAPTYVEAIATRKAFGETLAWLAGERSDLVVLDGEVGNSTYTEDVEAIAPERFFQMYIAEQTMIGAQTGMQALGKTAFSATFGAFLTTRVRPDPHGGDRPSRSPPVRFARGRLDRRGRPLPDGAGGPGGAPRDQRLHRPVSGRRERDGSARHAMADLPGISYIRTTREATPSLYGPDEEFPVGGSKTAP